MHSFRRILMPLGVAGQAEQRLNGALAVARHFQAHLDVLFTYVSPKQTIPQSIFGLSRQTMESLAQTADKHALNLAVDLENMFATLCEKQAVSTLGKPASDVTVTAKWHQIDGLRSQVCAQQGRVADLIVAAKPSYSGSSSLIEAVTTQTGRPVLLMPREQETFSADHIAIGWNGSMQVSRAVDCVIDMLKSANKITVLTTVDRIEQTPGANELSDYLAWHGITANVVTVDSDSRSVGEALFLKANDLAVDMLVCGAYSHRQVREMFVGSVTQYILSSADLPVLMAH